MNIGVIGTGDIGAVIVNKLRDAGYPVKIANSKGLSHSESSRRVRKTLLFPAEGPELGEASQPKTWFSRPVRNPAQRLCG